MVLKRFFKDLTKYRKYLVHSAKATLKSEVAGSYLAWLWWVIEPFCFMLIYTFIYKVVFDKHMPHVTLFVFLGLTFWDFFNRSVGSSAGLLKLNKIIITRIYLPKYLLYIKLMMVNTFKMFISLIICFVLMVVDGVPITWHLFEIVPCFIMLFIVVFGIGCVFVHFGVYVQDLSKMIRIVLRLVFYMSGVFYDISASIGSFYGKLLLKINPVAVAMDGCRKAFIDGVSPDWVMLGIWTGIGILISILGITMVYKNENNYGKIL